MNLTDLSESPGHIYHPHKASHMLPTSAPHSTPFQLTCFLLPSAGTPLPLLTPIPLQHHLYSLLKGWGQLCVSRLQGPPLWDRDTEW